MVTFGRHTFHGAEGFYLGLLSKENDRIGYIWRFFSKKKKKHNFNVSHSTVPPHKNLKFRGFEILYQNLDREFEVLD